VVLVQFGQKGQKWSPESNRKL